MEDIPPKVMDAILQSDRRSNPVVIIDSHNSISEMKLMSDQEVRDLGDSGIEAMNEAERMQREPFRIGAAFDRLEMFHPEDGIGPCGLSVLVSEVGDQRVAYVTIDGNNLKAGLREKMIAALMAKGVADGEIMTTDSHMVSGLVVTRLGYYPVGEGVDESLLMERLESAVDRAENDLEEAEVQWSSGAVVVKTLGRSAFENITQEVHNSARFVAGWMLLVFLIPAIFGLLVLR